MKASKFGCFFNTLPSVLKVGYFIYSLYKIETLYRHKVKVKVKVKVKQNTPHPNAKCEV